MDEATIEDAYALTPLQQGLLFHTLYAPEQGAYIEQFVCSFRGPLLANMLERAWQQVFARHPVLRSAFLWEDEELEEPLQIVYGGLPLRLQLEDLRHLSGDAYQEHLTTLLREERAHGFDLTRAPLMRLSLLRPGDSDWTLVWSYHHLLLDGWSVPLVLQEVWACYDALVEERSLALPPARPFRDYLAWLQSQPQEEAERYWRTALAGLTEPGVLWWTEEHAQRGAGHQDRVLSEKLSQELGELSRQEHVTLNTICQGAWGLLLSRYSGRQEAVFGGTVAGRPGDLAGVEGMVGLFINTLPVRVRVREEQGAGEWLRQMQGEQVQARSYEYVPLRQVQQWSGLPGGSALFESLLLFENYPLSSLKTELAGGVTIHGVRSFEQTHYPLTLAFTQRQEQMVLHSLYDLSRFSEQAVARLLDHFLELLSSLCAHPSGRLADLNLLTERERYQVLLDWNLPPQSVESAECLHTLVEAQVRRTPDAIALVFEDEQLTYAEVDRRANQLASHLQASGVRPETCVGLCLERTPLLAIALLAILKAGGAFIPLDPAYPPERLLFMLKDACASLLLTQRHLAARFAFPSVTALCLDEHWPEASDVRPRASGVLPAHLAYVIYTSGSTGRPKGVALTHASAVAFLHWACATFSARELAGVLASTSICFDLSIFELFAPLATGGCVLLIDQVILLENLLARARVTLINTVPSAVAHLLATKALAASVQTINLAGEPLQRSLVEQLYQQTAIKRVYNLYGPTEATTYSTVMLITPESQEKPAIGRPITNTQAYVLDERQRLVPVGAVGELYLGGSGLARGYLGQPELTAERFVPHPFSSQPGARLYRTGDLVRQQDDGSLHFVGRRDQQVKLRGFRIELAEVEAALLALLPLSQAVVVLQAEQGTSRLVAYVVARGDEKISMGQMRQRLGERLPGYMLPGELRQVAELPRLPNGKLDRWRVEQMAWQPEEEAGREQEEVGSGLEEELRRIWSQVLRREQVGSHDNFFDLGGDSILSLQVVARARQAGMYLQPRHIFQYQTISALAAQVSVAPQLTPLAPHEGVIPLTPIQHWFFSLNQPDPHHWNQSMLCELQSPFSPGDLETAWSLLQRQHGAFALRFLREGKSWKQLSCPGEEPARLVEIDLAGLAEAERNRAVREIATSMQESLDLEHGPLARAALVHAGRGEPGLLLFVLHHLIVDSVSWGILLTDFQSLYQQLLHRQKPALPAGTSSFQEWALCLEHHARSLELEREADYWLGELSARAYIPDFPVDFPQGTSSLAAVRKMTIELEREETTSLVRDLPASSRVQPEHVILAALQRVYAPWTGCQAVLIDVEGHGREQIFERIDLSRSIGWFTSMFPLVLSVAQDASLSELLRQVKEKLLSTRQHGLSYGVLRYLRQDARLMADLQSFSVPPICFTYLGDLEQTSFDQGDLTILSPVPGPHRSSTGILHHKHEISASISAQRLSITWLYSEQQYRTTTIEQLAWNTREHLRSLIAHGLSSPTWEGLTPSDFPHAHVNQAELDHLLAMLGQTGETPYAES